MTTKQREAIIRHGNNLLGIFPNATERDPIKLCKKLLKLESQAYQHTLELCNGDEPGEHGEQWRERHNSAMFLILNRVHVLLGNTTQNGGSVPVFINRDARGYALKIDDAWMRANGWTLNKSNRHTNGSGSISVARLRRDNGGYGIIAPEIGKDGE